MPCGEIRTLLDLWRELQGWNFAELGRQLGVSGASGWRYCTLPDHPEHRRPMRAAEDKLKELSNGALHAGNYADLWQNIPPNDPRAAGACDGPSRAAA